MNLVVVGSSPIALTGEICFNFSISNDLTQMVNFATQITDFDSHSPALLDLFISFDASICYTMAFHQLGNSNVVVSVPLTFHHIHNWIPRLFPLLMTILVLIGTDLVII